MIDFTGANLTGGDLRGADLKGMVNFENTVLHDVDFNGAFIDIRMIDFTGADIHNAKGLPSLPESNEYSAALKSFSESINQQFKSHNISPEQLKPIEESIKELVKEVQDIKEPEAINEIEKKNLHTKFADVVQKVIEPLPKPSEALSAFKLLVPFNKLIGEVPRLVETSIQKKEEADIIKRRYENADEWYKKGLESFQSKKIQ